MKRYIFLFSVVVSLFACTEDSIVPSEPGLVIEGYIENDGYPVVIVTRSLPVSSKKQNLNDIKDYLVRWAKVSVIHGTDTVVLTGKYDKGYFPPYVYTTGRMRGKVGETYKLEVEYDGQLAYATTTITSPPRVDGYKIEKCQDSDTLYQIRALMKADVGSANYYQFFARVGASNRQFLASFLGGYNDSISTGAYEVPVYRGHQSKEKDYVPYFSVNDTVAVKCCCLDEQEYAFWKAYIASEYLSGGAMLSASDNLPSNIVGGTGYWFGYGSVTSYFVIKDYEK